jgi:hypothetical protein|tara:strand:- start:38276 stop:38710 length:435 start_codon:yes stop_codon:yes gene_type:complete
MELEQIKSILEKDYYKVKNEKFEIDGQIVSQLEVILDFDDFPNIPTLKIYLMFLNNIEEELNGVSILQYYLPFTVSEKNNDILKNKIVDINKRLYLGHFGMSDEDIYIKYCQTVFEENSDSIKNKILNTISSVSFQFTSNISEF